MQNRSIWWVFCLWSCHCTRDVVLTLEIVKISQKSPSIPHALSAIHALQHRCKHSSVLSVNDHSRGTLKGPEARSGTAPQIPAPADRSFQQMMVNETQRRPAWRCGLEPLEVKHSYRLFQSFSCAFTCASNTFWFKTHELLILQTQRHTNMLFFLFTVYKQLSNIIYSVIIISIIIKILLLLIFIIIIVMMAIIIIIQNPV